jgi:transcriptional regulator of acetoin/glycerol metabolism
VISENDLQFVHPHTERHLTARQIGTLRDAERAHIVKALRIARWNKKEAAQLLDVSRGTLYRKIVEYGLESERTRTA